LSGILSRAAILASIRDAQDQALQIAGLRHVQQHGMIFGRASILNDAQRFVRVLRRIRYNFQKVA
jgi:hypothetical protein